MEGKVLIVDDDRSMCEMLATDLSRRGFDITWKMSAEDAFELVMSEPFDVVLTDLNLPEMSGIGLWSAISCTSSSPSVATAITTPPRALACWICEIIFSCQGSFGVRHKTGISSSISAIGPCFISPAG